MTAGTFALTTSDGDLLTGHYTGTGETSSKASAAVFEMHVDRGAGAFADAIGTLRGELKGSFAGDGPTRYPWSTELTTTQRTQFRLHAVIRGTTDAACVNGRIVLTLKGRPRAAVELRYELVGGVCGP